MGELAAGEEADSVAIKPVTATLSVAVKAVIDTVSELEFAGNVKVVTVGASVSGAGGRVIVVAALIEAETFPAASLAQA